MLKLNGKVTQNKIKNTESYILNDSKDNDAIVEIFGVDGAGKSYLDIYIIFKTFYDSYGGSKNGGALPPPSGFQLD